MKFVIISVNYCHMYCTSVPFHLNRSEESNATDMAQCLRKSLKGIVTFCIIVISNMIAILFLILAMRSFRFVRMSPDTEHWLGSVYTKRQRLSQQDYSK